MRGLPSVCNIWSIGTGQEALNVWTYIVQSVQLHNVYVLSTAYCCRVKVASRKMTLGDSTESYHLLRIIVSVVCAACLWTTLCVPPARDTVSVVTWSTVVSRHHVLSYTVTDIVRSITLWRFGATCLLHIQGRRINGSEENSPPWKPQILDWTRWG
jgi:hypothetical protein